MDGEILKRIIKQAGLTQEEFAEKIGTSRATINLLTQKHTISEDWKKKISKVLNIDWNSYYGKDSEDNSVKVSKSELDRLWDIINAQQRLIDSLQKDKE